MNAAITRINEQTDYFAYTPYGQPEIISIWTHDQARHIGYLWDEGEGLFSVRTGDPADDKPAPLRYALTRLVEFANAPYTEYTEDEYDAMYRAGIIDER